MAKKNGFDTTPATVASPETNAAPIETPVPLVQPGDVKLEAGKFNRRGIIRMPKGSVGDDLRNSKIWKKVKASRQTALIKLDELLIFGHDESWYARAIVAKATNTEALLAVERIGTFRAIDDQLYSDGQYKVAWNGHSYVVVRVSDDILVDSIGYTTEQQAILAIQRQHPTVSAY
jgi:hypothetical protein